MKLLFNSIKNAYQNGSNIVSETLKSPINWSSRNICNLFQNNTANLNSSLLKKIQSYFLAIIGAVVSMPALIPGSIGCSIQLIKGTFKPNGPIESTDALLPRTDPKIVGLIYKMCQDFDEILTKHNVLWSAQGGTLLGIERHEGFIPWDDDADLQLYPGEENKLADSQIINGRTYYQVKDEIKSELAAKGLKLARHWGGWKLCPIKYPDFAKAYCENEPEVKQFCYPFVDVFISKNDPNNPDHIIVDEIANSSISLDNLPNWGNREYFTEQEFKSVVKKTYGPIQLPVPPNAIDYCTRAYGANCFNTAKITFDHATGKCHNPALIGKIVDFTSAKFDDQCFKGNW